MLISSTTALAIWLLGFWPGQELPTSDPRPSTTGAPSVSFLEEGCRLEVTSGVHWHRLWLNCGSGPFLVTEPSSFMWHVRILRPEQALELVRLFSTVHACEQMPQPRWLEVSRAAKDDWLELADRSFIQTCPAPASQAVLDPGAPLKLFAVKRCMLDVQDGSLYAVEEHVRENGETTLVDKKQVLRNAIRRVGGCFPPGSPPDACY